MRGLHHPRRHPFPGRNLQELSAVLLQEGRCPGTKRPRERPEPGERNKSVKHVSGSRPPSRLIAARQEAGAAGWRGRLFFLGLRGIGNFRGWSPPVTAVTLMTPAVRRQAADMRRPRLGVVFFATSREIPFGTTEPEDGGMHKILLLCLAGPAASWPVLALGAVYGFSAGLPLGHLHREHSGCFLFASYGCFPKSGASSRPRRAWSSWSDSWGLHHLFHVISRRRACPVVGVAQDGLNVAAQNALAFLPAISASCAAESCKRRRAPWIPDSRPALAGVVCGEAANMTENHCTMPGERGPQARMAGATVTRGFMGFGANSLLHTAKLLRLPRTCRSSSRSWTPRPASPISFLWPKPCVRGAIVVEEAGPYSTCHGHKGRDEPGCGHGGPDHTPVGRRRPAPARGSRRSGGREKNDRGDRHRRGPAGAGRHAASLDVLNSFPAACARAPPPSETIRGIRPRTS